MKHQKSSPLGLRGELKVEVRDAATGKLKKAYRHKNLVVDAGLNLLRDMLGDDRNCAPNWFYLGTNPAVAAASDTVSTITSPFTKLFTARIRGNKAISFQTFMTTSEGNGVTYNEAGLVNSFDGTDTLFARVAINPIVKTSSITVTFTWSITLSAV